MIVNEVREKANPNRRQPEPAKLRWTQRLGRAVDTIASDLMPAWGHRRAMARYGHELAQKQIDLVERLGYWPGATFSESRDYRYLGMRGAPDDAIESDLDELQSKCVELYRGNTVAHSAVEGRVSYEVGTGLTRSPRVRESGRVSKQQAELINDEIKELYDRWSAHGVDKRRRLSLAATQRLVCRTYAIYGEVFVMLSQSPYQGPIGLTVDVISPERVETPPEKRNDPNCRLGVQYTAGGAILGYWVRYEHPHARLPQQRRSRYEYRLVRRFDASGQPNILHIFDPMFPEQSRGVPWLATAMNRMKDLDDFFEAELIGKQIEASFGLIIKSGGGGLSPQEIAERRSAGQNATLYPNLRTEDLSPGAINYINSDDDVTTIDPNRPGSTFAPFIEQGLRSIAASINYPYEALAKNFFRTTFSSGRLAMLDGWMGFAMRQQVLIEQFLQPLHRRVINDGVFIGALPSIDITDYVVRPYVYERHRWIGQPRSFIDPEKETKAANLAIEGGIETKANVWAMKGDDWESAEEQLDQEERRKIELRTEREAWENELRAAAGLPPIQRQYVEPSSGSDKTTMPEIAPTDPADQPEDQGAMV